MINTKRWWCYDTLWKILINQRAMWIRHLEECRLTRLPTKNSLSPNPGSWRVFHCCKWPLQTTHTPGVSRSSSIRYPTILVCQCQLTHWRARSEDGRNKVRVDDLIRLHTCMSLSLRVSSHKGCHLRAYFCLATIHVWALPFSAWSAKVLMHVESMHHCSMIMNVE